MKQLVFVIMLFTLTSVGASAAITESQAKQQAVNWIVARQNVILSRVEACITEGNPRLCHTSFAASVVPNTVPSANSLATVTFDDLGRNDQCGVPTGNGTFAKAGISIPATAPLNAKINIFKGPLGWGVQVVIRIRYDGVLYERGFARGNHVSGFAWREVVVGI